MFIEEKIEVTKLFVLSDGFLGSSAGLRLFNLACNSKKAKRLMEAYNITWKIRADIKSLEVTSRAESDSKTMLHIIGNFHSVVVEKMVTLMWENKKSRRKK